MSEDVEWGVEGELVEVFVGVEEAEMWLEESLPGLEVVVVESSAGEGGDFAEVLGAEGGDGEEGAGFEGVGEALKESWEVADPLEDGVGEEEVEVCGEGESLEVSGDEGGAWAVLVSCKDGKGLRLVTDVGYEYGMKLKGEFKTREEALAAGKKYLERFHKAVERKESRKLTPAEKVAKMTPEEREAYLAAIMAA